MGATDELCAPLTAHLLGLTPEFRGPRGREGWLPDARHRTKYKDASRRGGIGYSDGYLQFSTPIGFGRATGATKLAEACERGPMRILWPPAMHLL